MPWPEEEHALSRPTWELIAGTLVRNAEAFLTPSVYRTNREVGILRVPDVNFRAHLPPWLHRSGARGLGHRSRSTGNDVASTSGRVSVTRAGRAELQVGRRLILQAPVWLSLAAAFVVQEQADALVPARIDFAKAPKRAFDPSDQRLRDAATIFGQALDAQTIDEEDRLWTEVIDRYGEIEAEWVPDILSRAWGNRGNCRSRQGKMEDALADFDHSIALAPYAADPVLNRGVVLESLGRFEEAAADYKAVLAVQPDDPAALNNLGNVQAAMSRWDEALSNYRRAVQLAPEFSFAAANYALALYQVGRDNEAVRQFRSLLRRYPEFPDVRAALAVALYAQGMTAEAENNWGRLEDGRYKDRNWVQNTRRWPPRLTTALENFLDVKPN